METAGRWEKSLLESAMQQHEQLKQFVPGVHARLKPAMFPTCQASTHSEAGMDSAAHVLTGEHTCVASSDYMDADNPHITVASNHAAQHTDMQLDCRTTIFVVRTCTARY